MCVFFCIPVPNPPHPKHRYRYTSGIGGLDRYTKYRYTSRYTNNRYT